MVEVAQGDRVDIPDDPIDRLRESPCDGPRSHEPDGEHRDRSQRVVDNEVLERIVEPPGAVSQLGDLRDVRGVSFVPDIDEEIPDHAIRAGLIVVEPGSRLEHPIEPRRELGVGPETRVAELVLELGEEPDIIDVRVLDADVPDGIAELDGLLSKAHPIADHAELEDVPVVRGRSVCILPELARCPVVDDTVRVEPARVPDPIEVAGDIIAAPEVEALVGRIGRELDHVRHVDHVQVHPVIEDLSLDPREVHGRRVPSSALVLLEEPQETLVHLTVHHVVEKGVSRLDQQNLVDQLRLGLVLKKAAVFAEVVFGDGIVHHRESDHGQRDQGDDEDEERLRERARTQMDHSSTFGILNMMYRGKNKTCRIPIFTAWEEDRTHVRSRHPGTSAPRRLFERQCLCIS